MTIQIRNQRPATLYNDPFNILPDVNANKSMGDFQSDITNHIKATYIQPMYQPINAQHPVVIEDHATSTPTPIDEDTLYNGIMHLWTSDTLDVQLQDQISDIYRQGIQYHAPNDWYFEEQLGVEAITRMKLPVPTQKGGRVVRYTASVDVIPTAKAFLAQPDAMNATNWFANITAYAHDRPFNNYLLMTVQTADVFNDVKQYVQNFVQIWQTQNAPISQDVNKLLADFDKIDLTTELSAGLFLPNGGGGAQPEQDVLSFTRIIMYALSQYEKNSGVPGALTIQPSNLQQVYFPENIIILNLENYAHAKPSEIKDDWDVFEKALAAKKALRFISNKKLMTAKAMSRSAGGGMASTASSAGKDIARAKVQPFSGKPIPAKKMLAMMAKVIQSQVTKQVTQNTYQTQKSSFMRPNRRKPDDINLPGKLTTTQYRPDIHVYLDTSGSISESQYRDAVTNLIMLTKQINCNLYITSFSHYVSQTALLKTKDRSTEHIYQQFLAIPKVTGGTDFEQVWRKIEMIDENNQKNNLSHQINFIITDFGYSLSRGHRWDRAQASVKNTYYVPISIDQRHWNSMRDWAKQFREQMIKAGDYGVRRRMLM